MKIKIEELYSKNMFPNLIIGKATDNEYNISLSNMQKLLNDNNTINISEIKWTQLYDNDGKSLGYGSYGHICGVKIQISDGFDRYDFSIIFNYLPENENINEKINKIISEINWKENSFKWNIGDL